MKTTGQLLSLTEMSPVAPGAQHQFQQGVVAEILPTGEIMVSFPADKSARNVRCDFLEVCDRPILSLEIGDKVLVLMPGGPGENGCVLGRVGRYPGADAEYTDPKHVVIEAKKELKLKCGDSSIELRRDGKLLIKGVDVVA